MLYGDLCKTPTHSQNTLTPTTFLERSGRVFPNKAAIIGPMGIITNGALLNRARSLADLLDSLNIGYGDRVAVLAENSLPIIDVHFSIPAIGAILVMLNPQSSIKEIEYLLDFSGSTTLILDARFSHKISSESRKNLKKLRNIIMFNGVSGLGNVIVYEKCMDVGTQTNRELDKIVRDENDILAINFTSGTTGMPKGVMCTHRGAYLHSIGQILMLGLNPSSKYLWTLPMFHVNGWGHIWANTAISATQIIPSLKTDDDILQLIDKHSITHLCGAPRLVRKLTQPITENSKLAGLTITTGGAAPSPSFIQQLEETGVQFIHQYGLNETYGPYVVCERQEEWGKMPLASQANLLARQGVPTIHAGTGMRVVDKKMQDVPHDGETLGEVIMKGNTVSVGYYKNHESTKQVFRRGWFHSGDIAVVHHDGYIEIRDRVKDLIYVETDYGWENISSIEIENLISGHEQVSDVAVVGVPSENTAIIIAFIETIGSIRFIDKELMEICEKGLPSHKRPEFFYFRNIPKTSTGKVRKDVLLADAVSLVSRNIKK